MFLLNPKSLLVASFALLGEAAPHGNPNDFSSNTGPRKPSMASCSPPQDQKRTAKAIYFLTNDQQNAVVALPIAADGTLSAGTVTSTGGKGSNSISGTTKAPAAPDALIGQSALTVVGKNIFAVNAGSNSLSMMTISPEDPTKITVTGQPAVLAGEFPNTVAASAKHQLACVGSTGAKAGISCSKFCSSGLGKMDQLRSFNLGQTTPPVGPTNSVSQTFFSADESRLFTTVKGDPATNKTGFFSVFAVNANGAKNGSNLSMQDTRSEVPGTAVLFGSQVIPNTSSVFVTDASFGAAILSLDKASNKASLVAKQALKDQKATCWATISSATGSAFVTDVGANRIVEMSLKDASVISNVDLSATGDPGLIDLKAGGSFIYALSPGNGTTPAAVTVLDVSGGQGSAKMVQHFQLQQLGVGKNAQGMAVLE